MGTICTNIEPPPYTEGEILKARDERWAEEDKKASGKVLCSSGKCGHNRVRKRLPYITKTVLHPILLEIDKYLDEHGEMHARSDLHERLKQILST